MKKFLVGLMLAWPLFGCSSPKEETGAAENQHQPLANALHQPLDQARSVEKQVFESAEQQKKQADDL